MKIDLHVHSVAAEGVFTPAELAVKAKAGGMEIISIADNGTLQAQPEAINEFNKAGITYMPGIEFGMRYLNLDADLGVCGYNFDMKNDKLLKLLSIMEKDAIENVKLKLKILKKEGYEISEEKLKKFAEKKYPNYSDKFLGARVINDYIQDYLKANTLVWQYVEGLLVKNEVKKNHYRKCEEIMEALNAANATIVLARPGFYETEYGFSAYEVEKMVQNMISMGLDGIEVFTPRNSPFHQNYYLGLARKYNLVITAGSEYIGKKGEKELNEIEYPGWVDQQIKARLLSK